jgi:lipid II:glycine glycyltransferase (peptidoglycan interpeptide bridge formation enzyme)
MRSGSVAEEWLAHTGNTVCCSTADDDPAWDAFVASVPGGSHVQTSMWARVKAVVHWRAVRIMLLHNDTIVAGAQVLMHRMPALGAIGYIPKGPLCSTGNVTIARTIIDTIPHTEELRQVQYLVIQPPNDGQALACLLPTWGIRPALMDALPTATVVLDLTEGPDAILARMKRQTRQNIHRSERSGVTVREGSAEDIPLLYDFHQVSARRQDFVPYPLEYFTALWDAFAPSGHAVLFVAECASSALAALLVIPFGQKVVTAACGWSGEQGHCRPNEALYWAAIRWGCAHGFAYLDMDTFDARLARLLLAGGTLTDADHRTPDAFKLGLGGEVMLCPEAFEYIYNPLLRLSYQTIFPRLAHFPQMYRFLNRFRQR